jgi:GntR family transcriptional regulator
MTFVPRYYEIEQELRSRIARLEVGDPLPSDAELCAEFGVSRMTARNAVRRLVDEELAQRVPGRGTFVAEASRRRETRLLSSFTSEMQTLGRVPSSTVLTRRQRKPARLEARRLELAEGTSVVAVVRVRLADGEPIAVENAVFPATVADVILSLDLEHESLHAGLVAAGHVPARGRGTIASVAASASDAENLRVELGAPLLVEQRLIIDGQGRPIEFTESRYVGERYALNVEFDVNTSDSVA